MIHTIIKFTAVFIGGIAVAFAVFQVLPILNSTQITKDGGKQIQNEVNSRVEKVTKEKTIAAEGAVGQVLSSASESSILAPLFRTKAKVENTVETVMGLPEEQRNAICSQICQ
ncbi:MAG: hypothetical protein A3D24_01425 [Candidatus Blackburnbacteria bacterium RIFCSPHIGHO2_02_FULL_39_13]|uniref:Uncharacterized protein n=1 Tax=Candidatus Blackburnbacteria bacterium RIFCSPLOWO2_01_FULL_40_20 TaxID=1797519 RepID=A0A1G1VF85_9BACT|nr:MAG: hypothetical protein UT38_C0006G0028 [Microgenomates group bacterium GW2011_GWA2_39_19]OGY06789.1 MAG: hypothetical protein A2694_00530 [Candidatus Blackburnbacteria bacterium RIFCSPHIGHO2_01_FULL_40_17]OGY09804.1 MAG: hypothetical protein A3D24_01425 [Candidatus Blackburnbacteria bacterium RIFCSPHIGHO2_02_FULL_39_13]OGY14084.1 MAG: hypothetical protein A3A77_03870 [Candidatus Blackburnbacteria bacterium RIFCSPLOWO2_01_FULL_40_20]HBL52289.1 hypothetical protein [Candidatus Blackburnbact